jgi:hypothetical protein
VNGIEVVWPGSDAISGGSRPADGWNVRFEWSIAGSHPVDDDRCRSIRSSVVEWNGIRQDGTERASWKVKLRTRAR